MDFMQNMIPNRPQQPVRPLTAEATAEPRTERGHHREKSDMLSRFTGAGASTLLLVIVALLVAAVVWSLFTSAPNTQSKYVDSSKLQAVFLNTGQVYFGNVSSLNKDTLVLHNVYYLQSSNSSASSKDTTANQNISLVKLGCELHMPYDQMVVNTTQVTFWENLQADGQVAKAVASWQKQNPDGQKCSSTPASNSSSSNLQNAGTTKP